MEHQKELFTSFVVGKPFPWPDRDHQWEPAISRLQAELPQLMVLGEYDPQKRSGPAMWLRCILADSRQEGTCRHLYSL
ncbi:MAG: hypothetical protein U5R49_13985 [Deltaproteobacteria bacterium]|nr:hypothetical protein [Deltaproteobacteria bacterium]